MNPLLIRNGSIIDGSGANAETGDILIIDGKIEEIRKYGVNGKRPSEILPESTSGIYVIDATDKCITPGFIDIHRHCDYALFKPGFGEIELAQGITTAITGSCGLTPYPYIKDFENGLNSLLSPCLGKKQNGVDFSGYSSFSQAVGHTPLPLNIGSLLGSCATRIAVKGYARSAYTEAEMIKTGKYVADAMDNGCFGLSMGIMYLPEFYSSREELTKIAGMIKPYGGTLTCHIRGEGDSLVQSVREITAIARDAGVKLEISHFKACGVKNWGKSIYLAIEEIEKAQASGLDVGVDFYPYAGGATTLMSIIPPAYMKESLDSTLDFMSSQQGADALRQSLGQYYDDWDNYVQTLGWNRMIISSVQTEQNQKLIGKNISAIASEYGFTDEYEAVCAILTEEQGNAGLIVMSMSESDINAVASLPYSSIISDSLYPEGANPHPRLYGSFAKIIRDFVLKRKILTLPEAISKMTLKPALAIGIQNRGLLKVGNKADINIFEPCNVIDHANYESPRRLSAGMNYVIVNGRIALKNGKMIDGANLGRQLQFGGK